MRMQFALEERDQLLAALKPLVDDDECEFDHHGYCQAHNWYQDSVCPRERARAFLAGDQPIDADDPADRD